MRYGCKRNNFYVNQLVNDDMTYKYERGAAGELQEHCGPKDHAILQPLLMPPPRQPYLGKTYFLPGVKVYHRDCALLSETNRQGE